MNSLHNIIATISQHKGIGLVSVFYMMADLSAVSQWDALLQE